MGENLKFGPTENGRLTKEDGLKSKNARKQTHFKIQFYNRKKVTSFKIFILTFSLSPKFIINIIVITSIALVEW